MDVGARHGVEDEAGIGGRGAEARALGDEE